MTEPTVAAVRALVAEQFPHWSDLSVTAVHPQGHDNRTFRLGAELVVRLPSGPGYAAAVAKEDRWLPVIGPHVAVAVPEVVTTGHPGEGFPHPWSVRRWLPGDPLPAAGPVDDPRLGADLGRFLRELRGTPAADGPPAGDHSFGRGLHPRCYDDEVEAALRGLAPGVDRAACAEVWAEALATSWSGEPVWFHGDLAPGNLLAVDGRLSAVIDFGVCGVGDPACDLVIAWTWLGAAGRAAFRDAVDLDEGTWARARGWALWKALITEPGSPLHGEQQRALTTLLAERRTRRLGTPADTDTDTDTARTGEQPGPRAGMSDPRGSMTRMDDSAPISRTEAQGAVTALGWRLLLGELVTVVPLDSLAEGAGLLAAVTAELGIEGNAHLRADLRSDRLRLALQHRATGRVTAGDLELANRVTAVLDRPLAPVGDHRTDPVQELEIAVDALDIPSVVPFWAAVLGLVPDPGDPTGALADPAGRLPTVWFQQMDAERPQRNRIHLDITVPHDVADERVAAAVAAGGTLLSDDEARAFWVLADAEGNEVCVCTWQDRDRPGEVSPAG